jgi:hypothetical protein
MVCTPIYSFSTPEGKYLEPATSLHPIKAEGYENFAGCLDKNPYKHLQDFEEIWVTLLIS